MSTRPNECGACGTGHGSGEPCPELDGAKRKMRRVALTVRFNAWVPDGTSSTGLCLGLDVDAVEVTTDTGKLVEGGRVEEYETVSVDDNDDGSGEEDS